MRPSVHIQPRILILGLPSPSNSPSSKDVTQNETETRIQTLKVGQQKRVLEFLVRTAKTTSKVYEEFGSGGKGDYSFCSVAHSHDLIDSWSICHFPGVI